MQKMTVRDIDVKGKKVIIRLDFNVPLDASFHITDDRRITASLPTIWKTADVRKPGFFHLMFASQRPSQSFAQRQSSATTTAGMTRAGFDCSIRGFIRFYFR